MEEPVSAALMPNTSWDDQWELVLDRKTPAFRRDRSKRSPRIAQAGTVPAQAWHRRA